MKEPKSRKRGARKLESEPDHAIPLHPRYGEQVDLEDTLKDLEEEFDEQPRRRVPKPRGKF